MFKRNATPECILTAAPSSKAGGACESILKKGQNTAQAEEQGKNKRLRNNAGNTKVVEEGVGGDAPGTIGLIPVEKTTMK